MRKIIVTLLIVLVTMTGYKARGDIQEAHPELYYIRTDYYTQAFAVIHDESDSGTHKVVITIDPDLEEQKLLDTIPNTYAYITLNDEEYNKWIGGAEVFEGTLSLITVVKADDRTMNTYLVDTDVPTVDVLRRAASDSEFILQLTKKQIEPYLRKNKYIYHKL